MNARSKLGLVATLIMALGFPTLGIANDEVRMITATTKKDMISLGATVSVEFVIKNAGREAWHLQKPDQAQHVFLHYKVKKTVEVTGKYPLGQVVVLPRTGKDGQQIIAYAAPPRVEIVIKSGESYTFPIIVAPTSGAISQPGIWELWLEDEEQHLTSNQLTFTVRFTPESIPLLLSIAEGDENSTPLLAWARDWLRQIKPDFSFMLPNFGKETKEETTSRHVENKKALTAFREYWGKEKDSDVVKQLFSHINESVHVPSSQPSKR